MKEYDRYIIWLDYLDSQLSRREGRRVSSSIAIRNPELSEIEGAAKTLGLQGEVVKARHPRRTHRLSGYISLPKIQRKLDLLRSIARTISATRTGTASR